MSTEPFWNISRYQEDMEWIKDYTDNYLIYNKGDALPPEFKSVSVPNFGGNQHDIFRFIVDNYDSLPDFMIFLQGYPFDHCKKETFDKLIKNREFTALEDHAFHPENGLHKKDVDGGYMELNTSWYIGAHNESFNLTCIYDTYDHFMNSVFKNYKNETYCKFAPGSQYLVEKERILKYSKKFWQHLIDVIPKRLGDTGGTETRVIERGMTSIFLGKYEAVDELC